MNLLIQIGESFGSNLTMTMSNKLKRRLRQQELLKNFEGDFYQEKKIGENWLVKSWNGTVGRWQVGVYSEDSFRRYKEFSENKKRLSYLTAKD